MKTLEHWLLAYEEHHQNPHNVAIHKIAVPAIVFSLFGMLWLLPFPGWSVFFNWAILVGITVFLYYLRLSIPLALGFFLVLIIKTAALYSIKKYLDISLWIFMIGLFVIAWILQFIGHHIEGKRPSFLQDLRFLLVGPLWILHSLYRKIGFYFGKFAKK